LTQGIDAKRRPLNLNCFASHAPDSNSFAAALFFPLEYLLFPVPAGAFVTNDEVGFVSIGIVGVA
jgi:hypothetical protein